MVTRLTQTDNVDAIIGSMSSANILATADIVEQAQVLEIGCGTSPTWTNAGYEYVFRGTQNAASFNTGIVELMTRMGVTRLGTMVSSTEYATTGWAEVKEQLADTDIEIVLEKMCIRDRLLTAVSLVRVQLGEPSIAATRRGGNTSLEGNADTGL